MKTAKSLMMALTYKNKCLYTFTKQLKIKVKPNIQMYHFILLKKKKNFYDSTNLQHL